MIAGSAILCPRILTKGSNEKSNSQKSTCMCKHTVAASITSFSDATLKRKLGFPNLTGNAARQKRESSTTSTFSLAKPCPGCDIDFNGSAEV